MMGARDPIVVLTGEQLRAFVNDAIREAMARAAAFNDHDILDMEQTAKLLGVSPQTVKRMTKKGLPTLRKVGNMWRFSRRAVLAWAEKREGKE